MINGMNFWENIAFSTIYAALLMVALWVLDAPAWAVVGFGGVAYAAGLDPRTRRRP